MRVERMNFSRYACGIDQARIRLVRNLCGVEKSE